MAKLDNAILFSLSANQELASSIAKKLGVKLGERSIKKFPSGETMVEPIDSVRGNLPGIQSSDFEYTSMCSFSLLIPFESFLGE